MSEYTVRGIPHVAVLAVLGSEIRLEFGGAHADLVASTVRGLWAWCVEGAGRA